MPTEIPISRSPLSNEIPVSSFSRVKKTQSKTQSKTKSRTKRRKTRRRITPRSRLRSNDSLSLTELAKQIANEEKQPSGCIGKACNYIKSKLTRRRGGKRKRKRTRKKRRKRRRKR